MRDPIERAADESRDLQEVATWEPRSTLDVIAVHSHRIGLAGLRAAIITLAFLILVAQVVLGGIAAVVDPIIGGFVILSIVPALAIAGYIWHLDVTEREPLSLLLITFLLGVLFAGFAGVINTIGILPFLWIGTLAEATVPAVAEVIAFAGLVGFFFLIVGPVEETVKLLAVRLYAYRSARFDAVINGTVYGAAAGLGFATIENALYIVQGLESGVSGVEALRPAGDVAAARALAGPGHVLYSALAGYYLGLAKFNPSQRGPLVVKGILIAAVLHALYNTLVGPVPELLAMAIQPVSPEIGLVLFITGYLGAVGYLLYRKIRRYSKTYHALGLTR